MNAIRMMNAIQMLSWQPWVERLGWTLVHFLWQGALIAVLYAGARRGMVRVSSPNTRYLLACAALAAMMAAPLGTWSLTRQSGGIPDPAYRVHSAPPAASILTTTLPAAVRTTVSNVPPVAFLPWVVAIWLIGAAVFWVRLAGGWVVAARMRSTQVRAAPPEWQQTLARLGARIKLGRPVRLLVSALVQAPTVVGWLRPVVLVPVGALTGLPPEQVEALLLHELAHIRRHDYLVNILQSVGEALLFYHPAVWWISGHIRIERELCCDDVAVAISGDALTYARALSEWEECRPAHLTVTLAANGGSLAHRIARLLGQSRPAPRTGLGPGAIMVAILLVVAAYRVFGQSNERPAFQAASIKPNTQANPRGMMIRPQPGGRITSENTPLLMLIQNAYSVQAFQIVGGPPWINTAGYDIEAKPEGSADRTQMWLMLQTLLADRFKLAFHRETRELPLYALTMTKGGLRQSPSKEALCVTLPPDAPPPRPGSGQILCGHVVVTMSPAGLKLEGGKVPIAELVRVVSMVMGRPVVDRSGVTSEFDVRLDFTPDETTSGLPGSGGPRAAAGYPPPQNDPSRPTIFDALQEQLGLKMVTAKGPVEVLVIDHVERPTEN